MIEKLEMEKIAFYGRDCIWANNWEDEGFIEVRLDRFFGSAQWLLDHSTAMVQHVERHSSDHSFLIMDTHPAQSRRRVRFYFDKRWISKPGFEETVEKAW